MFVPKGYVLLTAAVDRLAEARRTAGQANDDGKNAARAELRAELHSGSISTMVISPSSGDAFVILQQHWALDEKALTWLEQGECLLDGVSFYPYKPELDGPGRWPRAERGERATIFVSDHDLQRLMARQEVEQEAAPQLDVKKLCPKTPLLPDESHEEAREDEKKAGPQQRRILPVLTKLYPPDGKVPDDVSTEVVKGQVAGELSADSKNRGLADPSWDTVNRVLGREKK